MISKPSQSVRYPLLRKRAATFVCDLVPKKLKAVEGVPVRKVSVWRNSGGAFADIAVLMHANPQYAIPVRDFFADIARAITETRELCFFTSSCAEQKDDGEEDAAQVEAITNPTPETLDAYIVKAKKARASLDVNIAAAEQMKARLEAKGRK